MQFVNPVFLFGLFAIAVPVIIHLFNFRRFRKVYFTNVRFLQQLKQETQKRSKLRHLIILALRILAVAALVFAFSQPYIPYKLGQAPIAARNTVSVFVDNSFSMEAVGDNGTLLDEARLKAREIVSAYKASDNFQLLTNDFEGRHQRLLTKDEFLTLLEEVKPSPASRKLPEILSRQSDLLSTSPSSHRTAFILSDFQESAYAYPFSAKDTAMQVFLVPSKAGSTGNVYIDSVWFDLPMQQVGQTAVLNTRIWNKSGSDLEKIPVKLEINGSQRAVASVDLKAGASTELKLPFTNNKAGIQQGVVQVTDYPVVYDDQFYFSYEVTRALKVLCINGKDQNKYISSLFSQDSSIVLTNLPEKSLDYSKFPSYNLIILNELPSMASGLSQELKRFVEEGGSVAVLPSSNPDLTSYNSFLSSLNCPVYQSLDTTDNTVDHLNLESPIFRDVFEKTGSKSGGLDENTEMPKVFRYFPMLSATRTQVQSLMRFLNGKDLLCFTNSGEGKVFQFSVPLDPAFTNFPRQAIFVPTFYNIALISRPPLRLYYETAKNDAIRVNYTSPGAEKVFRIKSLDGDFELIPEHHQAGVASNIFVNGQITKAGNYVLLSEQDTIAGLSFNYNRDESDPTCLTPDQIKENINKSRLTNIDILNTGHKPVNEILTEMNNGRQLWKYFIWFALLCLLAEVLLLRKWKY